MLTFFLYMTLYPDIQTRAQAEIDTVMGPNQLPTAADREKLPYVNAVINESLRIGKVTPQGVPHQVRADDVYKDYLIPRGALVIPNLW
jgi:cytochrome P450